MCWWFGHRWVHESTFAVFGGRPDRHAAECKRCGVRVDLRGTDYRVAKFVRKLDGWRGDARLYRVSPRQVEAVSAGRVEFDFVVVSAAVVPFSGPECFMFAAHEHGEPISWAALDGSEQGHLCHERVLTDAGYVVEA